MVTANLISAFVFAIRIAQSLYFLYPKFQASSHLLLLYSLVCVGPARKPLRPVFSQRGSYKSGVQGSPNYRGTCVSIKSSSANGQSKQRGLRGVVVKLLVNQGSWIQSRASPIFRMRLLNQCPISA